MTCLPVGKLRACVDGEASPQERRRVEKHIAGCARCSERLAALEQSARLAQNQLAKLRPVAEPDVRMGLARVRAKLEEQDVAQIERRWRRFNMRGNRARAWRVAGVGLVILALLVGVFSFAPSRAIARQVLSVFRVRKFAAIQIQPGSEDQLEQLGRALEDSLFVREPEVVVDEPAVKVSSIEEASQLAGFQVRMPKYLPGQGDVEIQVKGRSEFAFHLTRDALVMLLELANMDPAQVPTGWEEATIRVAIPSGVGISFDRFLIGQVLDPTVEYPGGLDPRIIGEAGLRLFGLSPKEAQRISEHIDWTNTVVLPIPADVAEFREVEVAGEEAILLRPRYQPGPEPVQVDEEGVPVAGPEGETQVLVGTEASSELKGNEATLLWEKDGVLYFVVGRTGMETLVQIAESMF